MALLLALEKLGQDGQVFKQSLLAHARAQPTLSTAQALLAQAPSSWGEDGVAAIRKAVDLAARPLQRYRCAACGFEAQHWFWQCPGCLGWDSFPPQPIEEL
jgi:lipopolysaccharide biosynthesis regulator YciM